jgi:hypothetical protein
MRSSDDLSDVTVVVGAGRQEFELHRVILAAASDALRVLVSSPGQDGLGQDLPLPHYDASTFQHVVEFIYTGEFQGTPNNADLVHLVRFADEFRVSHSSFLMRSSWE